MEYAGSMKCGFRANTMPCNGTQPDMLLAGTGFEKRDDGHGRRFNSSTAAAGKAVNRGAEMMEKEDFQLI